MDMFGRIDDAFWLEEDEDREDVEDRGSLPGPFSQIRCLKKKWTDQPTDGPTDKASYRDAWTHLRTTAIVVRKKSSSARLYSTGHLSRDWSLARK